MSKLEQLIEQLCPDGVEYKALGEIAEYSKTRIPISTITVDEYIGVENLLQNKAGRTTASSLPLNTDVAIAFECDDIVIGNIRPYLRKIWLADCNGGTNGDVLTVHINDKTVVMPRFLYYVLSSEKFFFYDIQNSKGAKMPRGDKAAVMRYICPIPPLEVQVEIVRILDKFTELTTELTTELANRKKQFEYYRDKLLSYEHSVSLEELGKVAKVTKLAGFEFTNYVQYSDAGKVIALRGLNVKDGKLILNDVKYIDNSDLSKLDRSKLRVGDMLFTYVGTVGQVALIDENDKYYLAPNVAMIRIEDERLLPKYLMYYFQSSIFKEKQINRLLQSSSMKNIPMEKIRKFIVPIPPIQTQERIIAVLDSFESICTDLNIGLPAEIEARQKQYEHYRDLLLSFNKIRRE